MITIEMGKLIIPEEERFVGIAGDNLTSTVEFALHHHFERNCTFLLKLGFDDGTVRSIQLNSVYYSSDVELIWNVRREDIYSSGIVSAQVEIHYPDNRVAVTNRNYFIVGYSGDSPEEYDSDYVLHTELEDKVSMLRAEIVGTASASKEYAKTYTDTVTAGLARSADVYTKTQIDEMIGNLEDTLAEV